MSPKNNGFSIIEVLIVVAIAAILTAIAIPAFNVFIGNTRTSTVANEFVSALNLARSEAMKRGVDVYVCRSSNGTSCATGGDWGQGWLVYFTDEDNNDIPIRVREGLKEPESFGGFGYFDEDNAIIAFRPDGRLVKEVADEIGYEEGDDAGHGFNVTSKGRSRCIRVNSAGRIRTESGACD
ncbi:GspH/FimT family pseudopilin [Desulfonatronum thiodismutans]|uniref:GspH/FimT family pseudopilin n=1 Tax=Desulfonatronum thiodismutans TaxID=159290 RepID=UPI00068C3421|nr:GspH/FimT family pseudopilin [Desulfonatronum thiodismutans]